MLIQKNFKKKSSKISKLLALLVIFVDSLLLVESRDNIYALISDTDYPPANENIEICNAGIVIGDDGVLVIDNGKN